MVPAIETGDELTRFELDGAEVAALVRGERSSDRWEAIELTVTPSGGTPLHRLTVDKLFYVVDGEVELVVGDQRRVTGPGGSAWIPAGVDHAVRNPADRPARLLVVTSGAGHVAFLAGLSDLGTSGAGADVVAAHLAAHGVTVR